MNRRRSTALLSVALMVGLGLPVSVWAAAPVAVDDTFTVAEDAAATAVPVLDNDSDDDGDALLITDRTNASKGAVVITGGGEGLTYNPNTNATGADSFTYTISDGNGGEDTATVELTITPANDPPTASNDNRDVAEDITTVLTVLANDDDIDGDALTIATASDGAKGTTAIIDGDTKIRYDPNSNATGADAFTYTISDGHGGQDTATVTIAITAVNDPPNAVDDSKTLSEDAAPTLIDVLANDTDVDDADDSLVVTGVTQGARGAVAFTPSGVTYIPNLNEHGGDSFTYTVSDGDDTDTASVVVTIVSENDLPNAVNDAFAIDEDADPTLFDVRDNDTDVDGDGLVISDTSDPAKGSVSVDGGGIRYDPDSNANGSDSFSYEVSDGQGGTDSATVSVTITPINDDPIADDDIVGVPEDASATPLLVLAGDIDADGDTLLINGKTNGTKGIVAITGGGTGLTYDPFTNQVGADSFTYTISDSHGGFDTATVTVTIGGDNDRPNAVNDPSMSVPQGSGARALDVLANDSDVDGDDLTITSVTSPAHGTVAITGFGTGLTYNPAGIYKGTDTFKYTVSDNNGGTDTATVVVTVVRDTVDPGVIAPVQRLLGQTVGSSTTKVRLSWSATDAGVGVASFRLQVSTNGGGYKTIKLAKATSKTVDRTLTTGNRYRFRVAATDKEGNVSTFRYGPTFLVSRYSQENSKVAYVGSWRKSLTSKALNGSTRNASTATKSATFTFTGYDVGWITTRATTSGRAEIYLDGVLVKAIDLDTSSTAYRKLVFQRHFSTLATHTLRIRPLGDGRVDIDGFAVLR